MRAYVYFSAEHKQQQAVRSEMIPNINESDKEMAVDMRNLLHQSGQRSVIKTHYIIYIIIMLMMHLSLNPFHRSGP